MLFIKMRRISLLALTVLCAVGHLVASREICYPVVGCYNNLPPFDNALGALPSSPGAVGSSFILYSSAYPHTPEVLHYDYNIRQGNFSDLFEPSVPTKVIVHGYLNSAQTEWVPRMRDAFLNKTEANVIVVDWAKGASSPLYEQAAANTRLVGTELELLLRGLQLFNGLQLEDVHLVGHSLGAHVSGYAGALLLGKVGRISGLDPAGPLFENHPAVVRLHAFDAKFVDVIHTNARNISIFGGFGSRIISGHVDFYPNGGYQQPGCSTDGVNGVAAGIWDTLQDNGLSLITNIGNEGSCSHGRANQLFIESIVSDNSGCEFIAYPCPSYTEFLQEKCNTCPEEGCNVAGYHSSPLKALGGKAYFKTHDKSPFCMP